MAAEVDRLESKNLTALLVKCQEIVNRICRQAGGPPSQEVLELQRAVHEAQGAGHGSKLSEHQVLLTWEIALDIWVRAQARHEGFGPLAPALYWACRCRITIQSSQQSARQPFRT